MNTNFEKYIEALIRKRRYDLLWEMRGFEDRVLSEKGFIDRIAKDLEKEEIGTLHAGMLAEIMLSLDGSSISGSPNEEVAYWGDPASFLRELVSRFMAHSIHAHVRSEEEKCSDENEDTPADLLREVRETMDLHFPTPTSPPAMVSH